MFDRINYPASNSDYGYDIKIADDIYLHQIHRITVPPPEARDIPTPASALAFDTQQELLWVGNEYVSRAMYETQKTGGLSKAY